VWTINPKRDRMSDLIHRMRRFVSDVLASHDIVVRFRLPSEMDDMRLAVETRRQIYMIFKEGVHNVVRHARCSTAEVEMTVDSSRLIMKVSDNETGLSCDVSAKGH
jgi:signal transduction histidine kinase